LSLARPNRNQYSAVGVAGEHELVIVLPGHFFVLASGSLLRRAERLLGLTALEASSEDGSRAGA
jgi:hypothetical protein